MKRLITYTFSFVIIIGTIAYATAFILSLTTGQSMIEYTYLKQVSINYGNYTSTMYYVDVSQYLVGLKNNVNTVFTIKIPEFPSLFGLDWLDGATLGTKTLINAFIWLTNWGSWLLNFTAVIPLKILFQPILMIMTILGLNNKQIGIYNAITVINTFNIPNIPYWSV